MSLTFHNLRRRRAAKAKAEAEAKEQETTKKATTKKPAKK